MSSDKKTYAKKESSPKYELRTSFAIKNRDNSNFKIKFSLSVFLEKIKQTYPNINNIEEVDCIKSCKNREGKTIYYIDIKRKKPPFIKLQEHFFNIVKSYAKKHHNNGNNKIINDNDLQPAFVFNIEPDEKSNNSQDSSIKNGDICLSLDNFELFNDLEIDEQDKINETNYYWFKFLSSYNFNPLSLWLSIINNNLILGIISILDLNDIFKKLLDKADRQFLTHKNKIYYGVPGCGKSHKVYEEIKKEEAFHLRTVFHPDYSNADFIGQIMPTVDDNGNIKYSFKPGPFSLALEEAYKKPNEDIFFVIEEINRGNAASIFGDVFQLLDRDDEGVSKYPIINLDIQKYLESKIENQKFEQIFIPKNLILVATMNTSDQNVFALDNAFKRRWNFIKIDNDIQNNENHPYKDWYVPGLDEPTTWKEFVVVINKIITKHQKDNLFLSEDKMIGQYFVDKNLLIESEEELKNNNKTLNEKAQFFANKVIMYLWEDVFKMDREAIFNSDYNSLDELIKDFCNKKMIFNQNFKTKIEEFRNQESKQTFSENQ
ncbi:AAA family ATPase [Mycoplasma sp. E35C]|uniref:AAA family ATPase n=1 Tax=Mycoplasma sp. E35C TaxID=2801918 RepID=UPI001CA3E209|nr:AAA family ATPase [Mycoplasma sp. E35C]QZX49406.1 AAA family ATPase [Mycoplasma sp. E35C]